MSSRRPSKLRAGGDGPLNIQLSDDDNSLEEGDTFATDYATPILPSTATARAYAIGSDPPSADPPSTATSHESSVLEIPSAPRGGIWDDDLIRLKGEGVQDTPTANATPTSSGVQAPMDGRASAHFQPVRPTEPGQLRNSSHHSHHSSGSGQKMAAVAAIPTATGVARRPSDSPAGIKGRRSYGESARKPGLRNSQHQSPGAYNEPTPAPVERSPAPAPAPAPRVPPPAPAPAPEPYPEDNDVILADATLVKPVAEPVHVTPPYDENRPRPGEPESSDNNVKYLIGFMFVGFVVVIAVIIAVVVVLTKPDSPSPAPSSTSIVASNFPTIPPTAAANPVPTMITPTTPAPVPAPAPGPEPTTAPAAAPTDTPTVAPAAAPTSIPVTPNTTTAVPVPVACNSTDDCGSGQFCSTNSTQCELLTCANWAVGAPADAIPYSEAPCVAEGAEEGLAFCGVDGNCYEYGCANWFEFGPTEFTSYDSTNPANLTCTAFTDGAQENMNSVVYGCRSYEPGSMAPEATTWTYFFNQECVATPQAGEEFKCYQNAADTDYSDFLGEIARLNPSACDTAIFANEQQMYWYNVVARQSRNGEVTNYKNERANTLSTFSFDASLADRSMFAVIADEPTPSPTARVPTPSPTTRNPTPSPTTRAPTTGNPIPPPTPGPTTFVDSLPNFTQVALQDPTSPQQRALDWVTLYPRYNVIDTWRREQLFAMATFYYSYNGQDWTGTEQGSSAGDDMWLSTTAHECDWGDSGNEQNECNADLRIIKLSLEEETANNVVGVTPPEVALLTDLQDLQIFTMNLLTNMEGALPSELATLTALTNLRLTALDLTGTIPSYISGFQQVTGLNIRTNELTGTIPTEFGLMNNLKFLTLRDNFLSGTVPTELANMEALESLVINNNDLSGSFPLVLCSMASLTNIRVDCLKLSGAAEAPASCNVICDDPEGSVPGQTPTTNGPAPTQPPAALPDPSSLTPFPTVDGDLVVGVHGYSLTALQDPTSPQSRALAWVENHPSLGTLPAWQRQQLFALMTFFYSFNGEAWPGFESENWGSYFVDECEWGDTIDPNECNQAGEYTKIAVEFISEFVGIEMPPELALLSSLEELRVNDNPTLIANIDEMLPTQLLQLPLTVLILEGNGLSGTLPSQLFEMRNLVNLRLNENLLSGTIPTEIGLLQNLQFLSLFDNPITGPLPSELGLLTSLRSIVIDQTLITGTVPEEICNLPLELLLDIDCTMIDPGICLEPRCGDSRETRH